MKLISVALMAGLAIGTSCPILTVSPALAQTTATSMICNRLSNDYEMLSKSISAITAEGVADDSAPRELVRQQRIGNEIGKAGVLISIITANKCNIPKEAPSDRYSSSALSCKLATMKSETSDACDRTEWKRDLGTITLFN